MPAAAVAIPAAISAGSSLFGGIMGSRASSKAASTQAAAADAARKYLEDQLAQYNPQIGAAAKTAADTVMGASGSAQDYLKTILGQNRSDVLGSSKAAQDLLAPYLGLGTDAAKTLSSLMQPGGDLNRQFSFEDIKTLDPGYQFRIDQANKALASSAAARGGALGGGAMRAAANLSENLASSEAGAAFSRLSQQQTDRFNRLNSMLGVGYGAARDTGTIGLNANEYLASQGVEGAKTLGDWMIQPAEWAGGLQTSAAEQMAGNALNTGRSVADLITGKANAQAAGTVGSANAWTNMASGLGNTASQVGNYYQGKDLLSMMKNPATSIAVGNLPTSTVPSYMRNFYGNPALYPNR